MVKLFAFWMIRDTMEKMFGASPGAMTLIFGLSIFDKIFSGYLFNFALNEPGGLPVHASGICKDEVENVAKTFAHVLYDDPWNVAMLNYAAVLDAYKETWDQLTPEQRAATQVGSPEDPYRDFEVNRD
jgi:hypothetical protein